jgi:hypothetical protein
VSTVHPLGRAPEPAPGARGLPEDRRGPGAHVEPVPSDRGLARRSARAVMIVTSKAPGDESVGAQRVLSFARHLALLGWRVALCVPATTPDPDVCPPERSVTTLGCGVLDVRMFVDRLAKGRIYGAGATRAAWGGLGAARASSVLRRTAVYLYDNVLAFPDAAWPWLVMGRARALSHARAFRPDVILSSSPPGTAHLIASRISRTVCKPWVADYRDLWSGNHQDTRASWARALSTRLEKRALRFVSEIVAVSEPNAASLQMMHRRPSTVVSNGFETSEFTSKRHPPERFTVVHAGTLYPQTRDPRPILNTVARLLSAGNLRRDLLSICFWGSYSLVLQEAVEALNLADVVRTGRLSRRDILIEIRNAHVLLLLESPSPVAIGVTTGKLYEYLGARRPIIATAPRHGEIAQVLSASGAGVIANTEAELETALSDHYSRFVRDRAGAPDLPKGAVAAYTRAKQAAVLSAVLTRVAEGA